ncbi:MAG: bacterial transcriptional activator domain-containing protein [Anaerolineales bacterium]
MAEVQGTASTNLDAHTLNAVQQAVELYQGDLLEGYYEDWCLFERERLQGILLNALAKLMAHYRSQGAYEQALRCGQRILHDDPLLEEVHREMMRLHCLAGNRGAALRQYGQCRAILAKELDIGPMEETTVLYEQICGSGEPGNPGQTEAEQDPFSATQAAPQPTPNAKQPHRPLAARMDEALHEMRLAQQEVQRLDTRFRRTVTVLKNIRRQVGDTEKA